MNRALRITATALSLATAAALAACSSGSSVPQISQITQQQSGVRITPPMAVQPRFEVLHPRPGQQLAPPAGLPLWNGSFTYNGKTYNYSMVGANPATSNVTTTIPVDIIPVKIVIGKDAKKMGNVFDPNSKLSNGKTVTANTLASPIYQSGIDFVQGGTDLGNTQYLDAFQRGNFWSLVSTNTGYHTILAPTVLKELTLKQPNGSTGNPFGNLKVAEVDINTFDAFIQSELTKLQIPPGTLPVFLTYNTYLTSGGCCIGGYHDFNGTNTYMQASYISQVGDFSQDVSALSHETGEWYDDPLTNNAVACGILEVGDPLEGEKNYGGYPYTLNGFTYNLQDLVFLPYFGAPASTSVNSWDSFQDANLGVCSHGG